LLALKVKVNKLMIKIVILEVTLAIAAVEQKRDFS
jgi:hypothetical protein